MLGDEGCSCSIPKLSGSGFIGRGTQLNGAAGSISKASKVILFDKPAYKTTSKLR